MMKMFPQYHTYLVSLSLLPSLSSSSSPTTTPLLLIPLPPTPLLPSTPTPSEYRGLRFFQESTRPSPVPPYHPLPLSYPALPTSSSPTTHLPLAIPRVTLTDHHERYHHRLRFSCRTYKIRRVVAPCGFEDHFQRSHASFVLFRSDDLAVFGYQIRRDPCAVQTVEDLRVLP